jgi:hypothetical protein
MYELLHDCRNTGVWGKSWERKERMVAVRNMESYSPDFGRRMQRVRPPNPRALYLSTPAMIASQSPKGTLPSSRRTPFLPGGNWELPYLLIPCPFPLSPPLPTFCPSTIKSATQRDTILVLFFYLIHNTLALWKLSLKFRELTGYCKNILRRSLLL